ncbi:MAG: hypothetical protein H6860_04195 [Rhodospirillales bacterium]|nr:hypothetical protein [Rhodospirillales bacterium]
MDCRAEAHFRIADQEFQRARQIDVQQDTPNKIESFTLVDYGDNNLT